MRSCADLPPLPQAMPRTGDRPRGEAGGLAHRGRPEPRRPRGREGRQDLSLTTEWRGGRRWAPWPRRGGRRRGGRRPLGGRGGATGLACLQPLHRRNPERFRAGKRRARDLLAQRRSKRVRHGNRCGGHPDVDQQFHSAAYMSRRLSHRVILSSVADSLLSLKEESTACTCMQRLVMARSRRHSYVNTALCTSAGGRRI
jgi:hypothetical protein